ncbi:hypothetical protein COT75_02895 [Candidatus Beckwithbacteria bacterium CG10_big_fil_rev_8_21_14_0_10_34_10]|uniref:Polysaccharide biosynthesis protein C-terminal domain-containing protein n=1 Tax=Candidatus Beckwithbacteria bacterium CG10_big_fil_rev_8_21_14_0_10_34_10 TaxID=1974495 RepID=A0A2H0W956_9BACT|nr:MAG: hypothetical protein COT75_02895 [Candidatus Beckwithbacteria bacterium CG10_big_fil_rev_8_21_14_0_10_34_10]
MKKIINSLFNLGKTRTAKNTYTVFAGNSIAGFMGMVLIILLSRFLGPAGFGVFSISFSFFTLLSKLADFGLNFAMVKDISQARAKKEDKKIIRIFETVFTVKLIITVLTALLGLLLVDWLSINLFKAPLTSGANRLVILFFAFFVFYDLVRVFFEANKRFLESTSIYIVSNLIKLLVVVFLFVFFSSFKEYIIIYLLGPFISALIFFPRTKLRLRIKFHSQEFKTLKKFASWMAVSVILAALGENLNVFMVSAKLSTYQTGIYSAAEKFLLPFYLFAGALGTVLVSRASEFLEFSHIKAFIKKVFVIQILFLIICLILFPLTSFLPLLLGSQYSASVPILKILVVAGFFRLAITPLNSVFYPLNKSFIFALDSFVQVLTLFVLNQRWLVKFQAQGAALALLVANILIFIFNYLYLFIQLKKHEKKAINLG